METESTGRVLTDVTVENLKDLWAVEQNLLPPDLVRRVVVKGAVVDTDATILALPQRLIEQLGLTRRITGNGGSAETTIYEAVRLTILGRGCTMDVIESSDDLRAVVGRLALLALDLVPDFRSCSLIGNPAHGGEQVLEAY
jgi:hypothetical protein